MATKKDSRVGRVHLEKMHQRINQVPPPPPPPPPFLVDSIAAAISSAFAGAAVGLVIGVLSRFLIATNGFGETNLLWWFIGGFIVGGLFGGLRSVIYNAILKNSSGIKSFKSRFPDAKDLPHDQLLIYWTEIKLASLFNYVRETFQEKKSSPPLDFSYAQDNDKERILSKRNGHNSQAVDTKSIIFDEALK
jgi:hypothetical protein